MDQAGALHEAGVGPDALGVERVVLSEISPSKPGSF